MSDSSFSRLQWGVEVKVKSKSRNGGRKLEGFSAQPFV